MSSSRSLSVGVVAVATAMVVATTASGSFGVQVKTVAPQKRFDFKRPDPGEVLPNPDLGTGEPPHLREFAPADPSKAFDAGAIAVAPEQATKDKSEGVAQAAPTTAPSASAATPSSVDATQAAIALQSSFADQIVRHGIRGAFAFMPDNVPTQDPADLRRWFRWKENLTEAQKP